MGYWKAKVLPQLKKVFDKDGKKAAASEFVKSFDESKEGINTEYEEKKAELQPKVLEAYEAAPSEIKTLVKERKLSGIKKNPAAVTNFLDELVKIDFPGAKQISEAVSKCGAARVSGPIILILEKVSTFLPVEEVAAKKEEAPAASMEEAAVVTKEVQVAEEKKEEIVAETEEAAKAEEKAEETVVEATSTATEAAMAESAPEPAKPEEETKA